MILFLFVITVAVATSAQNDLSSLSTDLQTDRHGFSCPMGSVFSQIPDNIDAGHFCQAGQNQYSILVAANYTTTTTPFSSFRFWGFDGGSGCTFGAVEPFDVYIWDGDPSNGGIGVFSGTFSGVTTETGQPYGFLPIYQIDIDLGELIQQQTGYIGITRKNPRCGQGFAWIADNEGDGQVRRKEANGEWVERTTDLFFCLSHKEPVPITNRAIYLTALLIGSFLFIRIRKIIYSRSFNPKH